MSPPVDPARFAAFLSIVIVMVLTPGPANLYAIATGAEKGKAAALVGMLGMTSGTLVWLAGAALGLSALVSTWPALFKVMTFAGAAYLAWLGLKSLWSARPSAADDGATQAHAPVRLGRSAFRGGFAVQIANPKALLFFTGVLPPFLDPARPLLSQLLALVGAVIVMDMVAMSAYGLGGAAISPRLAQPRFRQGFAVLVGILLLSASALIILHS